MVRGKKRGYWKGLYDEEAAENIKLREQVEQLKRDLDSLRSQVVDLETLLDNCQEEQRYG